MAFIGNTNTTQAFTPAIDYFSGNGSTTAFTLSRPIASVAQVQVVVNNVAQNPSSAYTVSGNTITFTSAPSSGTNNIYVYYTSPITQVIAPSQGTVGTTQLQNGLTVNFADGTAAAPSITNDGDTNTGVFYPAADTVGVSTGGSERLRVDSSGNVGIGAASPTSTTKFYVEQSAGNVLGYFNSTVASQNARVRINSTDTASSVAYVWSYSNASLNKQASIYLTNTGALATQVGQTAGAEPTAGTTAMVIDSSGNFQFNNGYGSVATAYGCRAWVNFNGTGTIAIRSSGNVSSITDGGVGIYRVNFTSSMPDANFTTVASSAGAGSVNNSTTAMLVNATSSTAQTANAAYVDVWCYHPGNQVAQDDAYINVSVFR